jgi:hypothetical protein
VNVLLYSRVGTKSLFQFFGDIQVKFTDAILFALFCVQNVEYTITLISPMHNEVQYSQIMIFLFSLKKNSFSQIFAKLFNNFDYDFVENENKFLLFRCDAEIVIENLFKVFDRDQERRHRITF